MIHTLTKVAEGGIQIVSNHYKEDENNHFLEKLEDLKNLEVKSEGAVNGKDLREILLDKCS